MPRLPFCLLLLLGLGTCSGTGPEGGPIPAPDGSKPRGIVVAGTRLVPQFYRYGDGAVGVEMADFALEPVLHPLCHLATTADSRLRCIPKDTAQKEAFFWDFECKEPIYGGPPESYSPYAVESPDGLALVYALRLETLPAMVWQRPAGSCTNGPPPARLMGRPLYRRDGGALPPDRFVEAQPLTDP